MNFLLGFLKQLLHTAQNLTLQPWRDTQNTSDEVPRLPLCLLLLPRREEPLGDLSRPPPSPAPGNTGSAGGRVPAIAASVLCPPRACSRYENLRFFMASALTARLLAQMVKTTMRTPTTNVTRGQRKQCRRTISSCVRCRSTSSGL